MQKNIENSPQIQSVVQKIVERYSPEKIYLFSHKVDLEGEVTSFKICVVVDVQNKRDVEKSIYIKIDSQVPFDIVIYNLEEWEKLSKQASTFAGRIFKTGVLLYG